MRPEGAIFDLDGTLTDSMHIWGEAPQAIVRRFGGQPAPDLALAIKEMGRREAAEYMIAAYHLSCTPEQVMQGVNDLVTAHYRDMVPMKAGADRLLSRLYDLGVPCAIATASEAFQAQAAMERLGLWHYFQFAISSIQYGSKTRPDIYLHAARRLNTRPERTLVFEDALHAARSARAGGFLVAGVYDPSAQGDRQAMEAVCQWYLPRLDDQGFFAVLDSDGPQPFDRNGVRSAE